jgi:hypothetical protein
MAPKNGAKIGRNGGSTRKKPLTLEKLPRADLVFLPSKLLFLPFATGLYLVLTGKESCIVSMPEHERLPP